MHVILILLAGAALAAPALVLEVRSAEREIVLPMRDTTFEYSYRQSIYDVPVREELAVDAGVIRIERALSADMRALEYFRWPGEATAADGMLAWQAPENGSERLRIAVVDQGDQTIDTGLRRVRLLEAFGATGVTVTPASRPLLVWLWSALWP